MIAALFPKANLEAVRHAPPSQASAASLLEDLTLQDLLDRHDKAATEAERQFYEDLIARSKDRI